MIRLSWARSTGRRWKLFRPFVQDDWRVTCDLTVNIGLAWALATPETEVANRQSNFDFESLKLYVPAGSPAISGCASASPADGRVGHSIRQDRLEPRIGLALEAIRRRSDRGSARAIPSPTIRPGIRADKACGKTRPSMPTDPILFGCLPWHLTPSAPIAVSNGFLNQARPLQYGPLVYHAREPRQLQRNHSIPEPQFQTRRRAAVQPQHRASDARISSW